MYEDRILRLLEQNPEVLYTEEDIQLTLIGKNSDFFQRHNPLMISPERHNLN